MRKTGNDVSFDGGLSELILLISNFMLFIGCCGDRRTVRNVTDLFVSQANWRVMDCKRYWMLIPVQCTLISVALGRDRIPYSSLHA